MPRVSSIYFALAVTMAFFPLVSGCSSTTPTPKSTQQLLQELLPTAPLKLPVIHVDDEHRQFEGGDNVAYEVNSGIGLILDATGYQFKIPEGANFKGPNMIQLMLDQTTFYAIPWKEGVTTYTLSMQTLNPLGNAGAFSGLFSGEDVVVAIGYQSDADNFHVLWAGIVNVME